MDTFIERLISRKKDRMDYLFYACIFIALLLLIPVMGIIPYLSGLSPFLFAGAVFGAYTLMKSRNIEFEYSFTNGILDIDRIVAQRKRKQVFSLNCREFEAVARVDSGHYQRMAGNAEKKLDFSSSLTSPDVYFILMTLNQQKTVLYFEPDQRMLDALKIYIRQKVLD
jgi:hypothetical protein